MSGVIYFLVLAAIAIITNLNKQKGKDKQAPRGGMPTFGGGGRDIGNPLPRRRKAGHVEQRGSGFPAPAGTRTAPNQPAPPPDAQEAPPSPAWAEAGQPAPGDETGEGVSLEQADDLDSVEARTERMQQELEKLKAAFDGMAAAVPSAGSDAGGEDADAASPAYAVHPLTGDPDTLRSGLVWAEVLGPPRARQPHSTRR
ncbi:hypothetical protein [Paenibacillus silagei]|uniref:Uncharacterized protein n=1 Tax=Paenibacillus silagei TaxID=1670801 RepID=A0ABS4NP40_9BACL|nr:hypothetical protein [Paenibacillus silagei]MBP2111825.1 hypothetical protein [Paenibacillus silagei]